MQNKNNPKETFFNLVKLIGKNYNEIEEKKGLWPFQLYNDKVNGLPYVQISKFKNIEIFVIP